MPHSTLDAIKFERAVHAAFATFFDDWNEYKDLGSLKIYFEYLSADPATHFDKLYSWLKPFLYDLHSDEENKERTSRIDTFRQFKLLFNPNRDYRETRVYRDVFFRALQAGDIRKNIARLLELLAINPLITPAESNVIVKAIASHFPISLYIQHAVDSIKANDTRDFIVPDQAVFVSWLDLDMLNFIPRFGLRTFTPKNKVAFDTVVTHIHTQAAAYITANPEEFAKGVIRKLEQDYSKQVKFYQSFSHNQKIKQAYAAAVKHFLASSSFTDTQRKNLLEYSCRKGSVANYRQWKFWSSEPTRTVTELKGCMTMAVGAAERPLMLRG